jgi:hypothetical protein
MDAVQDIISDAEKELKYGFGGFKKREPKLKSRREPKPTQDDVDDLLDDAVDAIADFFGGDKDEADEADNVCSAKPITEANIKVGTKVRLIANKADFEKAFNYVGYVWFDTMEVLLGANVTIVDRPQTNIFGLPKSDPNSWQQIWWYPFSVIDCIVEEDEPENVCADNAPAITESTVKVGTKVRLISDKDTFRKAFNAVGYVWDNAMEKILGEVVEVVDRPQTNIFGLPKSDPNSWQQIWWYPFSVIECIVEEDEPEEVSEIC